MSTSDRRSYHHGDLRAALLRSALDLLDADGADALSLRAVARHAGVSANAPYRHYQDKEALLAALAAHGFMELKARFEEASDGSKGGTASAPADLAGALAPVARATVHYALGHPGLFHLMFGHPCVSHAEVSAASDAALAVVTAHIAAFAAPEHREPLKVGVWALLYGLSLLLLDGRLGDPEPHQIDALVDSVVRTVISADWMSGGDVPDAPGAPGVPGAGSDEGEPVDGGGARA
ncbi:TetR/AcrR family transcriptional regulator [Streptomyces sp. NPDC048565]|uniref:TetR/AcrR family transcriptional regulator n=1 Tax=Streptomyces sp. NPDC048565 TaxID=3155266 RepID=UPI003426E1DF